MISISLFPLAGYFFLLAYFNGRKTPTVLSGLQDVMLLSLGLVGLFLYGPGKLLLPLNILTFWGCAAWAFWTAFYFIVCFLLAQKLRRRIVVYNCPEKILFPRILATAKEIDSDAQSLGNSVLLPRIGIQFCVETVPYSRNNTLVATGPSQTETGWLKLETEIATACRSLPVPFNRFAVLTLFVAVVLSITGVGCLWNDFPNVVDSVLESLP